VFPAPGAGPLGLLLLDTRFTRHPGDLGRPDAWGCPVLAHVVSRAEPARVVRKAGGFAQESLLPGFVDGARRLREQGAVAITTSCGFLVVAQQGLQDAVDVPVVTSALLLVPALLRDQPRVGVLTIDSRSLQAEHLAAAGVPAGRLGDVVVEGVDPRSHFTTAILGNETLLDRARAEQDVLAAAVALKAREPGLRTIVLECTNLPPYAERIAAETRCRVLSLRDHPVLAALRSAPSAPRPG
jgi:hypothetical protein